MDVEKVAEDLYAEAELYALHVYGSPPCKWADADEEHKEPCRVLARYVEARFAPLEEAALEWADATHTEDINRAGAKIRSALRIAREGPGDKP